MPDPARDGERRVGDRRSPHSYLDADGTLVFADRYGVMWRVYDRRRGDRRGDDNRADDDSRRADSAYFRAFVNEAGEEWHCVLRGDDIIDESTVGLEGQLDRASLHYASPSA